jgi:hypothetical protein
MKTPTADRGLAAATLLWLGACVPAGTGGPDALEGLPPPGLGTLRQDEVTVALRSGQLEIKVVPLDESVTRATAPDTYRRLSGLVSLHLPEAVRRAGIPDPALFVVSFFSDAPDVSFVPEELQLLSHGIRLRATTIIPITPAWGQRRLAQRETEVAVYAFPASVDLESDLVVAYGLVESRDWASILPVVQAERARARSRRPRP